MQNGQRYYYYHNFKIPTKSFFNFQILADDDDFFGYKSVLKRYQSNLLNIFDLSKKEFPNLEKLYVFGELFGGGLEGGDAVQQEIIYSSVLEFYAFDLCCETSDDPKSKLERKYLDFEFSIRVFKESKLFYAEPLFVGKLQDCLSYNVVFQSTIPSKLG